MPRLSIELSETEHRKIKALAALSGKSVREYVVERLFRKKAPADETLDAIEDAVAETNLSTYSSVEDLLDEIATDANTSDNKQV
jgi:hypothetical protein